MNKLKLVDSHSQIGAVCNPTIIHEKETRLYEDNSRLSVEQSSLESSHCDSLINAAILKLSMYLSE